MSSVSAFRVRRRGKGWGVQQKGRFFWRWIGPFGCPDWGRWADSSQALWFANFCERVDRKQATTLRNLDPRRQG